MVKVMLGIISVTLIWGYTWVAMKVGIHDIPPLLFSGLRLFIGAVPLFLILFIQRKKLAFNSKRTSQKLYHHEPVDGAGLYGDFDVWNAVCRFRENLCFGIYNAYICYGDQPFFIKRENECV